MRGPDVMQESSFSVAKLEDSVPADHPLRAIRLLVNEALARLDGSFGTTYADCGRESIVPEKPIRPSLLQVFYSVRSERQRMEQMRDNLLFRSKNRDRLLEHEAIESFFAEVMCLADQRNLLSKEHFSVDGALIQARVSQKSFRPKDGSGGRRQSGGRNAQADWKGRPRSNDTHESKTDPDARSYRKSHDTAAISCYQGHVLMEPASAQRRWRCWMPCRASGARPWVRARLTTPPISWRRAESGMSSVRSAKRCPARRQQKRRPHHTP